MTKVIRTTLRLEDLEASKRRLHSFPLIGFLSQNGFLPAGVFNEATSTHFLRRIQRAHVTFFTTSPLREMTNGAPIGNDIPDRTVQGAAPPLAELATTKQHVFTPSNKEYISASRILEKGISTCSRQGPLHRMHPEILGDIVSTIWHPHGPKVGIRAHNALTR